MSDATLFLTNFTDLNTAHVFRHSPPAFLTTRSTILFHGWKDDRPKAPVRSWDRIALVPRWQNRHPFRSLARPINHQDAAALCGCFWSTKSMWPIYWRRSLNDATKTTGFRKLLPGRSLLVHNPCRCSCKADREILRRSARSQWKSRNGRGPSWTGPRPHLHSSWSFRTSEVSVNRFLVEEQVA